MYNKEKRCDDEKIIKIWQWKYIKHTIDDEYINISKSKIKRINIELNWIKNEKRKKEMRQQSPETNA